MSLILALVGYSSCIGQLCCNGVCVSTSIMCVRVHVSYMYAQREEMLYGGSFFKGFYFLDILKKLFSSKIIFCSKKNWITHSCLMVCGRVLTLYSSVPGFSSTATIV